MWPESLEHRDAILARPSAIVAAVTGSPLPPDAVRPVYQPIVDLDSGRAIGFEALTRGPAGTDLESPGRLFGLVRSAGRLGEFDRACRDAALVAAARDGLEPPLSVFVNVEPELVESPWDGEREETWIRAPRELRCIIEITERDLTARPAALLHAVARVRERAWGVAMDDVGADPRSLALMALLRPDVIKLDMGVVQRRPDAQTAEVVAAVNAQAHATGALIVAEGIETDEHLRIATALGARLGQGWRLGRPAPLPDPLPAPGPPVRFLGSSIRSGADTPFELVREQQAMRRGDAAVVDHLMTHLAELAARLGASTVALAAQHETRVWDGGADAMTELAGTAALAGLLGDGSVDGARPFRTSGSRREDVLDGECAMVVISPHFSAAVVARSLSHLDGEEPRFEYGVTHERGVVTACARSLAARLAPAS